MIYLDHAASTPVRAAVVEAMSDCLRHEFANPGATHALGRAASQRISQARAQLGAAIGAKPRELIWTSGATEANNLALVGAARYYAGRGRHLVTAKTEHKSVVDPVRQLEAEGWSVSWLVPGESGRIEAEQVAGALRDDTVAVSLMSVNNETGVIQDVEAVGTLTRARGILLHVDAAQALGRLPLDMAESNVDLMSLSAHKLGGPKGAGALYVRLQPRARVRPLFHGGGQERGMRPGTVPVHQVVGMGLAAELAAAERENEQARLAGLRERLWDKLFAALPDIHRNGHAAPVVGNILNVSFEGVDGEALRADLTDLAVSSGSACTAGGGEPSYVLRALGRSDVLADASLRFSLGAPTIHADVDLAADAVIAAVRRLRALSPRWGRAA